MENYIGFIGAGNMAASLIRGAISVGIVGPEEIVTINKQNRERMDALVAEHGIREAGSLRELVEQCPTLVLAVKPDQVPEVLEELSRIPAGPPGVQIPTPEAGRRLLISVAAGVPLSYLEPPLGPDYSVVRSMPNIPSQVAEGVTALCAGTSVGTSERILAEKILGAVGRVFWVDENQLDVVTALSGSGPAYFFRFAEDMAAAGARMGLDPELAEQLARHTLSGAGHLLKGTSLSLRELVRKVTSPQGTTAAALEVFQGKRLDLMVEEAMAHAAARSREMAQTPGRHILTKAERVIVKVGSSTVTDASGRLNVNVLTELARQMAGLRASGKEIVLVSSGAVAAGRGRVQSRGAESLTERQVLSAVGQAILMQTYESLFAQHGITVAQVLLTKDDFTSPKRSETCRNTLSELCSRGIIPIINENDAVSFDEIKLGDNDTLSARVAVLVSAEALILLTDTDGLFSADPRLDPAATLLRTVEKIGPEVSAMAMPSTDLRGTGGMVTKLWAANLATENGIPTVIANGGSINVLLSVMAGKETGTFFPANGTEATKENLKTGGFAQ
jgi:glutamate 5-kinase